MKSVIKFTSAICGLTFGLAFCSSAAVETQFSDYGSAASPLLVGESDFPVQLAFQKFDTLLGTLTDVVISLTSMDYMQSEVLNFGPAATFQDARISAMVAVTGADGIQTSDMLATTPFSGSLAAGPSQVLGPAVGGTVSDSSHVAPANFGTYEAGGGGAFNYSLNAISFGTVSGTGGPELFFGYQAGSYGLVEIDYYYTPTGEIVTVPEPGTGVAGWMAIAAGVCAAGRRRFPGRPAGAGEGFAG